jgi:NTP pyrophosphatase (non-canonical NTP hydrolase)
MKMSEYQDEANKTSSAAGHQLYHAAFGLLAEAGEVAGIFQKIERGDYTFAQAKQKLEKELGDCLWYLSETCTVIGVNLDQIAEINIAKLRDRKSRSVIHGSGDER